MWKRLAGIVAGIVTAVLIVLLIEWLSAQLFPAAAAVASSGSLQDVPLPALLMVVLAWTLGTYAGALVATRIAAAVWPAWVVAAMIVAGVLANAAMIPHPAWMIAAGLALPPLAAWLASRRPRPRASSAEL